MRDIIAKSLSLERLEPEETATLLNVEDEDLWEEMYRRRRDKKKCLWGQDSDFRSSLL